MSRLKFEVLEEDGAHHVLGRQVGCVCLARDFDQRHYLLRALLLEPKAVHINVSYVRNSLPVQDALGSRCVKFQSNSKVAAEIGAQRSHAQSFTSATIHATELGLRRTLGYDGLRLRPHLDAVAVDRDVASRCTLSRSLTACPIGIRPNNYLRLLHRIPPD